MIILLSFLIGIVAGLRAMMALVLVSWAAYGGLVEIKGRWLEWLGYRFTPWILTVAALAELVTDKLPTTPSRRVPQQFGARLVSGGLAGAALASASVSGGGSWIVGLVAGVAGAVVGTLGGAAAGAALTRLFGRGNPAALVEDLVAIVLGIAVVLNT